MLSEKMIPLVKNNSVIRAMFEEGKEIAKEYGAENVFDFSLGNPNVPAPKEVKQAIFDILNEEPSTFVHGYMSNAGYEDVRETVAQSLNRRFQTEFHQQNIVMTVGAASGLNVVLKTILNSGDEVLVFAPYFVEYGSYVRNYDGVLNVVPPQFPDFQPNLQELENRINQRTKAVIINSPNNPTGVIYSPKTIEKLSEILVRKAEEIGHGIVLISDEPYRELVYDETQVPFVTKYYHNSVVVYSFSKSLSLPGERIGYLAIPDSFEDFPQFMSALSIATRVSGAVNAPSLMQRVILRCIDCKCDVEYYKKNRDLLYDTLTGLGFTCTKPEGAFYLWLKSPIEDEKEFCSQGKKYHLLMVPGGGFACPGYVRIAYCVSYETIVRSKAAFEKLAQDYDLCK